MGMPELMEIMDDVDYFPLFRYCQSRGATVFGWHVSLSQL